MLGSVEHPKVRVRGTDAQQNFFIAAVYRTGKANIGGSFCPSGRSLMPSKWIEKYKILRTRDKGWSPLSDMVMEAAETVYDRAIHVL